MHKIACLFSFRESSWISCQKIVFNLHRAYEDVKGDYEIVNFDFSQDTWGTDVIRLVVELEEAAPDTIVVMDHKPHPMYFLRLLLPRLQGKKKPRIIFHVFGDFTLYYEEWLALSPLMKDVPVEFVVASDRQKILIDKFLTPPHECKVCPFPVFSEEFYFLNDERTKQRKEWGVDENEVVFTFTGRISRQKRTHLLLKAFTEAVEREPNHKARLFIYGQPDHIADNFLNIWENENEYFRKIHRQYLALPDHIRSKIQFMGNVPNSELRRVYAGADYLVNLSVHNDEDFGMSVAEAQMSGLPAILTDWGGLASFEHPALPEATRYLEVKIGQRSKLISGKQTVEAICEAIRTPRNVPREKLVALACEKFSVQTCAKIIEKLLKQDAPLFNSFTELHTMIAKRMIFKKPVYMSRDQKIHSIYRKLYSAYVRNP